MYKGLEFKSFGKFKKPPCTWCICINGTIHCDSGICPLEPKDYCKDGDGCYKDEHCGPGKCKMWGWPFPSRCVVKIFCFEFKKWRNLIANPFNINDYVIIDQIFFFLNLELKLHIWLKDKYPYNISPM